MFLPASVEQQIVAEVKKYPQPRSALLPALKLAQGDGHYLSPEAIARVAELVGVSHAVANELATFYSMLHKEPLGETVIEVCAQLPCALRGADELLARLVEATGVQPGETTPGGQVTLLRTHECFGSCNRAPMCLVNHKYREGLHGEAQERFLDEVRALATGETGAAMGARGTEPSHA